MTKADACAPATLRTRPKGRNVRPILRKKKNDPFTNKNLSQTGRYKKESTTYLAFDSMYSMTLPTVVSFSASDSGISAPPI